MTIAKDDLRELADQALAAFRQVLVKRYPEAENGDAFWWYTIGLQIAAEDAIEEWIDNNVPATSE